MHFVCTLLFISKSVDCWLKKGWFWWRHHHDIRALQASFAFLISCLSFQCLQSTLLHLLSSLAPPHIHIYILILFLSSSLFPLCAGRLIFVNLFSVSFLFYRRSSDGHLEIHFRSLPILHSSHILLPFFFTPQKPHISYSFFLFFALIAYTLIANLNLCKLRSQPKYVQIAAACDPSRNLLCVNWRNISFFSSLLDLPSWTGCRCSFCS